MSKESYCIVSNLIVPMETFWTDVDDTMSEHRRVILSRP